MEDKEIVMLYWDRNERAIKESSVNIPQPIIS